MKVFVSMFLKLLNILKTIPKKGSKCACLEKISVWWKKMLEKSDRGLWMPESFLIPVDVLQIFVTYLVIDEQLKPN